MNCNTYTGCLYDMRVTICVETVEPRNRRILNINTSIFPHKMYICVHLPISDFVVKCTHNKVSVSDNT